jgi:hypothetical protein
MNSGWSSKTQVYQGSSLDPQPRGASQIPQRVLWRGWSSLPTSHGHGGDQGSPGVGGASPRGLPYPWELIGCMDSQRAKMNPGIR